MPAIDLQATLLSIRKTLAESIEEDEKEVSVIQNRVTKNKDLLHAINGSLGAVVSVSSGYGGVSETIRATINSLPQKQFVMHDVEQQILLNAPTANIAKESLRTVIWAMTKKGQLKQIRKGNNQIPALYEKVNADQPIS